MRRPSPFLRLQVLIAFAGASSGVFWSQLFFLTREAYGFSMRRNLVLGACMGLSSAIGARVAEPLCTRHRPRSVLCSALGCWSLIALLPYLVTGVEFTLWCAGLLGAACASLAWSVAESYAAAGRYGEDQRRALGLFTLSWMPATALPLLLPLQVPSGGTRALLFAALSAAFACACSFTLSEKPSAPRATAAPSEVHPEYTWLQRSAFRLLPLSYLVSSTIAPVLPERLASVGFAYAGPLGAATWLLARFVALGWMWRSSSWHGRWGTLVFSAAALAIGLTLTLTATTSAALIGGLCLYGVGMGIAYYSALYYTMAVGQATVQAGGHFEVAVGLSYAAGPVLGLIAHSLESDAHRVTVFLTLAISVLVAPFLLTPYLQARRSRSLADNASL